jgi:hypothetical protein
MAKQSMAVTTNFFRGDMMSEQNTETMSQPKPSNKQAAIAHLEALRQDMRGEIKDRIKQRDTYSIQLTIALAAIAAISVSGGNSAGARLNLQRVLIAAPLVSIYFTTLILYSYRIHGVIAGFLRTQVEPNLAQLCGISPEQEWEIYYQRHRVPGIRKTFFIAALWIICLATPVILLFAERGQDEFILPLGIISIVYLAATGLITKAFWKG